MAVRLLERVPIDRIQAQAKPVDLGRVLATLVVGFFYLLGFVVRKVALMLGVLLGWVIAAVVTGWQDAGKPAEERRHARAA